MKVRDGRLTARRDLVLAGNDVAIVSATYGEPAVAEASPPTIDLSAYRGGGLRFGAFVGPKTLGSPVGTAEFGMLRVSA